MPTLRSHMPARRSVRSGWSVFKAHLMPSELAPARSRTLEQLAVATICSAVYPCWAQTETSEEMPAAARAEQRLRPYGSQT